MTSSIHPEPDSADVAVVGAGIIGLSVAMHLVAQGRSVLLIDRKGIALETSAQNAGALAFSDILPLASPRILQGRCAGTRRFRSATSMCTGRRIGARRGTGALAPPP